MKIRLIGALLSILVGTVSTSHAIGYKIYQETLSDDSLYVVLEPGSVPVTLGAGISYQLMVSSGGLFFKGHADPNFSYDGHSTKCQVIYLDSITDAIVTLTLCLENDGSVTLQRGTSSNMDVMMQVMWN